MELATNSFSRSFTQLAEKLAEARFKQPIPFVIDIDLSNHLLPTASADLTLTPELTKRIAIQPVLQILLQEPFHLSPVIKIAFTDQDAFGSIRKSIYQGVGMSGDD